MSVGADVFGTYRWKIALPVGHEVKSAHVLTRRETKRYSTQQSGTIDADYRGEISNSHQPRTNSTITRGERIAQMVVAKYEAMNLYQVNGSRQDFL
jgi:dUTPase